MRDTIVINDNVISDSDCEYLIDFYKENGSTHNWLNYSVMSISPPGNERIREILSKVIEILNLQVEIDWCEIAKRPPGSGHPEHVDDVKDETIFTSVTYLNDNFTGGKTYIVDDIIVSPKKGRTLYFDGSNHKHGVSEVSGCDRYTLAVWYKHHD